MSADRAAPRLSRILREPANAITHGIGVFFGVAVLVVLVRLSRGDPWRIASFAVYGASLIALYSASTLLHGLRVGQAWQRRLLLIDHIAIFGLIAGTYTPITLVALSGPSPALGWTLFGLAWGLASLGAVFKIFWLEAPHWLSTGLYLLLGWLVALALVPLARVLPWEGLAWLVAGGLLYSVGAVVFVVRRPDPFPRTFGYHALWHLLVLAASASHFVFMLRYVLPG